MIRIILFFAILQIGFLSGNAQDSTITASNVKGLTTGTAVYYVVPSPKPDTILVARLVSITIQSTFWHQVDHSPFPVVLKEIIDGQHPVRYLKKLKHGWAPLPAYYKVWEN
ncbi:MAG TPA: hypothetical protein VKQ08_04755 [Cyclobacteriaceae bacterium]|nr:hypothetical protein [Cyclobacteriaceae bacterium]